MNDKKTGVNQAIATQRKRLLIDATMSAISQHGLTQLTLAKIAKEAGLSAGSVNFHFSSKEALLLETLAFLTDEYQISIDQSLRNAGNTPQQQLLALMEASMGETVTEPRKMAVWFSFTAEARRREDYQRICGAQDQKILSIYQQLCADIIRQNPNAGHMNSAAMANAIQGLVDDTWHEMLYAGDDYNRNDARNMYRSFLASVFPWAFDAPSRSSAKGGRLSTADKTLRISQAGDKDIKEVSVLFDLYRQFYKEPADTKLARKFIGDNIRKERAIVFVARDENDKPVGFTQLYPGWCSVAAAPFLTLYDLYVDDSVRKRGVGRALMKTAENYARKKKFSRIDLETAVDNHQAQALYEQLGYVRDIEFYKYSFELD
jgi:AcrR family transcriptional regulator/ribosomal protein S18 acetylase RimI-like enzyme